MSFCRLEERVIEGSVSGQWSDALDSHLASCPLCQDAVRVAHFMRELAAASHPERALADPRIVWVKAELLRQWALEEQAARPVDFMRRVAAAAGVVVPLAFAAWNGSAVWGWLTQVDPASLNLLAASGAPSIFLWLVALSLGMVAVTAILTLQTVLGRD